MARWLGLCTFAAQGLGSFPGRSNKILKATWHSQRSENKTSPEGLAPLWSGVLVARGD